MSEAPRFELMVSGEAVMASALAAATDGEFAAPSLLPGWDRAHVVAHLAGNAQALMRLISWAATGVRTPMYADGDERNRQIEELSSWAPAKLRAQCLADSATLVEAWQSLPPGSWDAGVQTFHGRDIPVKQVCWMRARESHVHAVDLGTSIAFADLDVDFLDPFLDDVTESMSAKVSTPIRLHDPSRMREWSIGETTAGDAIVVTGPTYALAQWVSGRGADPTLACAMGPLPSLPAWL